MPDYSFVAADHAAVASASKMLYARYRNYTTYEDIQQECYLWLLQKYDKVVQWRANYSERHAERTVVRALRNAGERYCRKEKAEADGYVVEDEFFYSIPMIADLLQLYFDPEWMVPRGIDYTSPKVSGKPPGEGGDLVVMVADVGRAVEGLPKPDRDLLSEVYGGKQIVSDAITVKSLEWGISWSAANSRVRRVVGRVRAALGGPNPWKEVE